MINADTNNAMISTYPLFFLAGDAFSMISLSQKQKVRWNDNTNMKKDNLHIRTVWNNNRIDFTSDGEKRQNWSE